jgi:hypothetical protein
MYKFSSAKKKAKLRAQLMGSGTILNEVINARNARKYGLPRCLERDELQELARWSGSHVTTCSTRISKCPMSRNVFQMRVRRASDTSKLATHFQMGSAA